MAEFMELLSAEGYGDLAARESADSVPVDAAGRRRRECLVPTPSGFLLGNPARARATEVARRPVGADERVDRAKCFAEIESLIIEKERTLRRRVWDVPEVDLLPRLVGEEQGARRRAQLAESARLAQVRRRGAISTSR